MAGGYQSVSVLPFFINFYAYRAVTWILHASEAFICKALKGEAIVKLSFALNNAADGCLRLAQRVKINEII